MSYKFSQYSLNQLNTCHKDLQTIAFEAITLFDFKVLEGHRSNKRQLELFEAGRSKLKPGQSKHNQDPSLAFDLVPCPIDWADSKRFVYLAGIIMGVAHMSGIKIRWGGNWDGDNIIIDDQNFDDLPHFELI